jgi:hypothetical protein
MNPDPEMVDPRPKRVCDNCADGIAQVTVGDSGSRRAEREHYCFSCFYCIYPPAEPIETHVNDEPVTIALKPGWGGDY